ncbi:flavodoxin family protein [Anaeromicropila herbilytica]|uniref:FMN reductase n=1 Tax=Anaeromicropila herbilytica TaxID=2785025 RepID=A0A7R7EI32_9FIRM|nr:flavodoxin family protein [Anaeromicropila herbilytica]BCN29276.1 FMN reductase [Anaeromicropila herbilytica]
MKVLGINGSARKNGNTALIMNMVFEELEKNEIETELIQFGKNIIQPCKGCFVCKGKKECIIHNDIFEDCFQKMVEADGILLGSPVYSADISANMKAFLERAGVVVATNPGLLKYKVGASVAAVRRGGGLNAIDTMNHFLLNKEVFIAGSTYWNMVYGKDVGDVLSDEEGIRNMHNLGTNIAWLLKKLNGYIV